VNLNMYISKKATLNTYNAYKKANEMITNRTLLRNAIKTPDGTVLESFEINDYKSHKDSISGEGYFVDGGLTNARCSKNAQEAEDLCVNYNSDFMLVREYLTWGTYGKNGDEPLTRLKLKDMEASHIEAVLNTQKIHVLVKNSLENEIKYRKVKKF
jgi:hypothetical protein